LTPAFSSFQFVIRAWITRVSSRTAVASSLPVGFVWGNTS